MIATFAAFVLGPQVLGPVSLQGEPYVVHRNGNLQRLADYDLEQYLTTSGEVKVSGPAAPILVTLHTRTEHVILKDGRVVRNRQYLDEAEVAAIRADFDRFERWAETSMNGALDLQFEFVIDGAPLRRSNDAGERLGIPVGRAFAWEDSSGKKLPAHFGAFEITPGGFWSGKGDSDWVPTSRIPYFGSSPFFERLKLGWQTLISDRATLAGYPNAPLRSTREYWQSLASAQETSSIDFVGRKAAPFDPSVPLGWIERKGSTYVGAADTYLDIASDGTLIGTLINAANTTFGTGYGCRLTLEGNRITISAGLALETNALKGAVTKGQVGIECAEAPGGDWKNAGTHAWCTEGTALPANLRLGGQDVPLEPASPEPNWNSIAIDRFESSPVDTDHGKGVELKFSAFRPNFGDLALGSWLTRHDGNSLQFWVKTNTDLPLAFQFGSTDFKINSNWGPPRVPTDDQWHQVTIPLADGWGAPFTLSLADPTLEEGVILGDRSVTLAGFSLVPTQPALPEAPPSYRTESLKSGTDAEKLNALGFASSFGKDAVEPLTVLSRNLDFSLSYMALLALNSMEDVDSSAVFSRAIEFGPYDHCREAAMLILGPQQCAQYTRELSSTITAPDWPVRQRAAWCLTQAATNDATIALLVMLRDPDERVRFQAALGADAKNELASRRLLYAAVNDPSELVRGAAYPALLSSTVPAHREQALRGVKDESARVRVAVLDGFAGSPMADQRGAIEQSLRDAYPRVRAAAIRALAKQPGEVKESTVEHLIRDPYPAIRAAMRELAKAKNLSFAWD